MTGWKTLKSDVVYETKWFKIHRDKVLNHTGKPLTYSYVELQHPSVFIVAVNSQGKVLLQKNYRYTLGQTIWELPAGHSDGQDPLVAAARELLEEDALESTTWTKLGRLYQAIGTARMPLDVCMARDVKPVKQHPQEDVEQIEERQFFSLSEIDSMVKNGELINASDIGAIQLAKLQGI